MELFSLLSRFVEQKLYPLVYNLLFTVLPKPKFLHTSPTIHSFPARSYLEVRCHPLEKHVTDEVNKYFVENWNFPTPQAIDKFRGARFSQSTCLCYPRALDDRIQFACRLLTLLFLVDDMLEDMSFDDGRTLNERLLSIMEGSQLPDLAIPAEKISHELWESMRLCDQELADQIIPPMRIFMRSQTDPKRKDNFVLSTYLQYREVDVGQDLLSAVMRFVMRLDLSEEELGLVRDVERTCARHVAVMNDIFSWEKEVKKSSICEEEGSILCSSVKVMMKESNLSSEASKRVLYGMCKEWELVHLELVEEKSVLGPDVAKYCQGLGYHMSGNEAWSRSTDRYA